MLWTFSFVLVVVWLLGLVTGYTMGGSIHALPVIAVLSAVLGGLRRRRFGATHWNRPSGRGA